MKINLWEKNILELIRRTSTDLPIDVETALKKSFAKERKGRWPAKILKSILENTDIARKESIPLCQDTGTLLFYFSVPVGFDTNILASVTRNAVSKATALGYLRQNTVDPVTSAIYPTNITHTSPQIRFKQGARKNIDVRLIMKGGGCENVS